MRNSRVLTKRARLWVVSRHEETVGADLCVRPMFEKSPEGRDTQVRPFR